MSVTVTDILKLPSMNGAKVVAGKNGLTKPLATISVLEYATPDMLQEELFHNDAFSGSEIVITAFANIATEVDFQCAIIRRLAAAGEIGLILYYVGIFMPSVDQRLIDLADQLDFVLIVMPENRMDLRYSEVISEVMEAVIKNQTTEISLLPDVLEQMGRLPEHKRTIDRVLRIVRDRLRTSLILADSHGRALGQANWPMYLDLQIDAFTQVNAMFPAVFPNNRTVWRCPLNQANPQSMELYLIKDGEPLNKELVFQTVELVRLAARLWSSKHAEIQISELIRAILRDEPLKMQRLADLFHIDVSSIHSMWVLHIENINKSLRKQYEAEALAQLRESLSHQYATVIADTYEGFIVGFMACPQQDKGENISSLSSELMECLSKSDIEATLIHCHSLSNTTEVRHAFLLIQEHLDNVKCIWPTRQSYSFEEVEFASQCHKVISKGEEVLKKMLKPLKMLESFNEGSALLTTLSVYLLDTDSSVSRCAEQLFVHKNTVKYRLRQISTCLEHRVDKEPEKFYLYQALALNRLLKRFQ